MDQNSSTACDTSSYSRNQQNQQSHSNSVLLQSVIPSRQREGNVNHQSFAASRVVKNNIRKSDSSFKYQDSSFNYYSETAKKKEFVSKQKDGLKQMKKIRELIRKKENIFDLSYIQQKSLLKQREIKQEKAINQTRERFHKSEMKCKKEISESKEKCKQKICVSRDKKIGQKKNAKNQLQKTINQLYNKIERSIQESKEKQKRERTKLRAKTEKALNLMFPLESIKNKPKRKMNNSGNMIKRS